MKLHCREPSRNSDVLLHIRRASSSSSSSALPVSTTDNGEEKMRHTARAAEKADKKGKVENEVFLNKEGGKYFAVVEIKLVPLPVLYPLIDS